MKPKLVRLFLAEEIPTGLRTIELSNTTVIGTIFPRASLDTFSQRDTANKPGVYILIGYEPDEPTIKRVYVGEGDPVLPRLRYHLSDPKKEFWIQTIVFSSKDDYLTKTQIQFLESSVIDKLGRASRSKIDNGNSPDLPSISETERSEAQHFLEIMSLLLAAIGIDILESRAATIPVNISEANNCFFYNIKTAQSSMVINSQGYVVLKDSTAIIKERPSINQSLQRMRQSLGNAGILEKKSEELYIFTADTPFDSPSTAASVISGGDTNGRTAWKLKNGKSLKELEEQSAKEQKSLKFGDVGQHSG